MILLISIYTPDALKSVNWRLWEYRQLHKSHYRYYRCQQKAYEATKLTVGVFVLCRGWIA